MKPSQRLRGRSLALKADMKCVSAKIDGHDGENQVELRNLLDRQGGYKVAADELMNLADELEREGL